jgi:ABC-type transport system substrate-binding protein
LRQIIANGIDRDSIIKDVFRAKLNQNREPPHRALHGPYPPGSWASSPNARRFNESIARLLASQHPGQRTLTLDYANDYAKLGENDTESKQACQQIAKQLQAFHIDVKVQPASTPEELHEKVEGTHDYQLAYYYYDYPSGAFNLWPLFDPKALGGNGTNFLGYRDDSAFTAPIQEMLAHRDFETLQKLTGQIQDQFHEKVPFIPLWQLDTHVAVHRDLKVGTIDPLRVFPGVENWKLEHSSR